jgi:hypothetical protein
MWGTKPTILSLNWRQQVPPLFSPIYQTAHHIPEDRNQKGRSLIIVQIHFMIKTTGATLCTLKEVSFKKRN